jgi:hypothetical protein
MADFPNIKHTDSGKIIRLSDRIALSDKLTGTE